MTEQLTQQAASYLQQLCDLAPSRVVGSARNLLATEMFAKWLRSYGWLVTTPEFNCIEWVEQGAELRSEDHVFAAMPSPFSLGCDVTAPVCVITDINELTKAELQGKVVLLRGEISREQLMPKNFSFYNPEEHQRIIRLLEQQNPLAIITASGRNPEAAGGMYPFSMFEDGDFDIPSAYMTAEEGERLSAYAGCDVSLSIASQRFPAKGCNVIAHKGNTTDRKVVICAHIDTKLGTPGALDNASGTVVLLLLAELLQEYTGDLGIELVAFNGEDYYSVPGQMHYLEQHQERMQQIGLVINLDMVGYKEGKTAFSLYNCSPELVQLVTEALGAKGELVGGDQWYQGDHAMFAMYGMPAVAFTSEQMKEAVQFTHTTADRLELVDASKLAETATAISQLLSRLPEITTRKLPV